MCSNPYSASPVKIQQLTFRDLLIIVSFVLPAKDADIIGWINDEITHS